MKPGSQPARLPALGGAEIARDQLYISAVRLWTPATPPASATPPTIDLAAIVVPDKID